jgi:SMC interacting uncharacterized protein involved in chromosome segregation
MTPEIAALVGGATSLIPLFAIVWSAAMAKSKIDQMEKIIDPQTPVKMETMNRDLNGLGDKLERRIEKVDVEFKELRREILCKNEEQDQIITGMRDSLNEIKGKLDMLIKNISAVRRQT